jgi:hypothetical protein
LSQHDTAHEKQATNGGNAPETEPSKRQRSVPGAGTCAGRTWPARGAMRALDRIRERGRRKDQRTDHSRRNNQKPLHANPSFET